MTQPTRLGFLGAGQMASALARGLVAEGRISGDQIAASDPSTEARKAFQAIASGAICGDDNLQLVALSENVVLAVKPQHVANLAVRLSGQFSNKLLISVVAGITIKQLSEHFGSQRVIRVMPNAPCLIGSGASAMAVGPEATQADREFVESMMSAVGRVHVVSEELLDAVTGLSGSGPAFVAMFIEALSDGGVRMGLPRAIALELAAQTVAGTAQMVLQSPIHPAQAQGSSGQSGRDHDCRHSGVGGAWISRSNDRRRCGRGSAGPVLWDNSAEHRGLPRFPGQWDRGRMDAKWANRSGPVSVPAYREKGAFMTRN
jgi:pyrroline-5-carboxylate reductase